MKTKKIPMRRCIGCMESRPKRELIRILAVPQEENQPYRVVLDPGGKAPGRGAYLCPKESCVQLAQKKKAFSRNLKTEISPESVAQLREEVKAYEP